MQKKILIEGMSCEHCAAHVKAALMELGSKNIFINLEKNFAIADTDATDDEISAIIGEAGYDVVGVE